MLEPPEVKKPELIVRDTSPEVLEFPFETLDEFITPNDLFFVRSHFDVPSIDIENWRLKVEGAVSNPIELTYEEVTAMRCRSVTATLECAGNCRSFLDPDTKGVKWQLGGVSNAIWYGVPLWSVLERAGIRGSAVDIVLEGADRGVVKDEVRPPDAIPFARSIPVSKAKDQDVILAHHMNTEVISAKHGYPLRAVVPGWFAMASVKWLTRIVVLNEPFNGHWQTVDYAYWERRNGLASRRMISEMLVKAEISRPSDGEVITKDSICLLRGAAWTSSGDITRVEVSCDGGQTWADGRLYGEYGPHTWRMWDYAWKVPNWPGEYVLMARAHDSQGRVQPMERDADRANYMINHALPIRVTVK